MPLRVLVPLDGSPEGEAVLGHLDRIVRPDSAISLLHVIPDPDPPTGPIPTEWIMLPGRIHEYLEGLSDRYSLRNAKTIIRIGPLADRIIQAALELDIHLILMMAHSRGGVPTRFTEKVVEAVVRGSSLPVLLVRPGLPDLPHPLRRLLVAVDGSRDSFRILQSVRLLSPKGPLEVAVLRLESPAYITEPWTEFTLGTTTGDPADAESSLEECVRALDGEGLRTRAMIARGDPAEEILRHAARLESDLIALAEIGQDGADPSVLGTAASILLRRMDRPLFLHRVLPGPFPSATGRR